MASFLANIKDILSGPSQPAHGNSSESFNQDPKFAWENTPEGSVARGYWNKRRENPGLRDKEYPRPTIMSDSQISGDDVAWDPTKLITGPAWERGSRNGLVEASAGAADSIDYIGLEEAHDQNKDFHHHNQNPWFKGDAYIVNESAIDDGIDYYSRNDIRNREDMLTSDFAVHGHNRETNLNRRAANMRADYESGIIPSRWKHDLQSIMPWDQLRDHTHNGKLYLPGDEPTKDDPLKPWYRPEEKTYEELTNKTTVDAPGRFEGGLMGEKIFYHQNIHHLKRKDINENEFHKYNGYMTGRVKDTARGNITKKNQNKIVEAGEYFGIGTSKADHRGRTEGFATAKAANNGYGKDIAGTIIGAIGKAKGMITGKTTKSRNRRKNTENYNGQDANHGRKGNKTEHFDYTTWAPLENREEKLFGIWNSRMEGNIGGNIKHGPTRITEEAEQALHQSRRKEYMIADRVKGHSDTKTGQGALVEGKLVSKSKRSAHNKASFGDRENRSANPDGNTNKGGVVFDAVQTEAGLRKTFDDTMIMEDATRVGNVYGKQAGVVKSKVNRQGRNALRKIEDSVREAGNPLGKIFAGLTEGFVNAGKSKKHVVEGKARNVGNVTSRPSGNAYLITKHEARDTLRSKIVSDYFTHGSKDFGIVSHQGIKNIDWHQDRNRKVAVTNEGARNNAPGKQDLGWGADQVNPTFWFKKRKQIRGEIINPQARSHHAPEYGNGAVNRKGRNYQRKVERAVHDGERAEFGFIKPRFLANGREKRLERNKSARNASRKAARIKPVDLI